MSHESLDSEDFRILCVDDTPANLAVLRETLTPEGYKLAFASSGEEALEIVQELGPDLILLDVMMPGIDGFETCRRLKENWQTNGIPIIFITAKKETEDIVKGLKAGGVDYITKPFQHEEMCARVRNHLELLFLRRKNEKIIEELREMNQKLDDMARKDQLTGLSNRRDMHEKLEEELNRSKRSNSPFSLIMADIDHFKKVNDNYGHNFGDYALVQTARVFKETARPYDVVSRWGGEEFLFLLPETDLKGGELMSERIREKISKETLNFETQSTNITMSFGVTSYHNPEEIEECIKRADENLYSAKEGGRNQVVSGQ